MCDRPFRYGRTRDLGSDLVFLPRSEPFSRPVWTLCARGVLWSRRTVLAAGGLDGRDGTGRSARGRSAGRWKDRRRWDEHERASADITATADGRTVAV